MPPYNDGGADFHKDYRKYYKDEADFWKTHASTVKSIIDGKFEETKHLLPVETKLEVRIFNRTSYPRTDPPDPKNEEKSNPQFGRLITYLTNDWRPHIAVSLHLNCALGDTRGYLNKYDENNIESTSLSNYITAAYAAMAPVKLPDGSYDSIPAATDMDSDASWMGAAPAALFAEPAYCDNAKDAYYIVHNSSELPKAIANGIYSYMVSKGYAAKAKKEDAE